MDISILNIVRPAEVGNALNIYRPSDSVILNVIYSATGYVFVMEGGGPAFSTEDNQNTFKPEQ